MEGDSGAHLHVAVFPWLAFGHILPYFELSKALARRGHRVSFLSTPRNIQRLPKVPPVSSHLLHLVQLPFPSGTPLPPGAEATSDIRLEDNGHLKKAFDELEAPFAAFLDSVSPPVDWVVHDFSAHWMPRLAVPRCLPCAYFSVFSPPCLAFFGAPSMVLGASGDGSDGSDWFSNVKSLTVPPPWISGIATTIAFYTYEAIGLSVVTVVNESGVSDSHRWASTNDSVQLVIVRSCPELDGDWIRLLQDLFAKPIIPAGFLSPAVQNGVARTVAANPDGEIFEWLDRQTPGSVLYVALGSEALLSVELFHELAQGLNLSGIPFLWALRRPASLPPDAELIPEGFEAETAGKGMVLAHPAVGSFLTHCGWSSIIEGLSHGLTLVLLPLFADQGLISRLAVERGYGREVPRAEEDGAFTREGVAETVRFVAADTAGEPLREAARAAAAVFSDYALQESYVDGLAQYLVENKYKLRP
ncbi:unnamed protein product [Spirodela intermedia]|uniref:Uncharacterized protein n=1 Tax=Spirodela intermedia TaxID=51605 RepID=A0A7I8KRU8_SPIIN|nr:unnamed protein product [Spirodela intermedia]